MLVLVYCAFDYINGLNEMLHHHYLHFLLPPHVLGARVAMGVLAGGAREEYLKAYLIRRELTNVWNGREMMKDM